MATKTTIGESKPQEVKQFPKWMIKFGFKGIPNRAKDCFVYYRLSSLEFKCFQREILFDKTSIQSKLLPHIKYVHQLQNLYFSLTQTELTYTP